LYSPTAFANGTLICPEVHHYSKVIGSSILFMWFDCVTYLFRSVHQLHNADRLIFVFVFFVHDMMVCMGFTLSIRPLRKMSSKIRLHLLMLKRRILRLLSKSMVYCCLWQFIV